jgi:PAS domain S-box-containing protein
MMDQPVQDFPAYMDIGAKDNSFTQKLMDFFPAMVYVYEMNTSEVTSVNRMLESYLGYSADELQKLPDNLLSLVYEEDVPIYRNALVSIQGLKQHQSFSFTARYNHKTGSCKTLRTECTVLKLDNGRPSEVLCVAQNLTEQIKAEEESGAIHQLMNEAERLLLFGTWTWTPRTDKLQWTDGMYEVLGYTKDEVAEVSIDFFLKHVLPEYLELVKTQLRNSATAGEEFSMEFVVRTKDGREKYMFSKGKVLLDKDGSVRRIVGITRDITSKKNFEKERDRNIRELNRSNKELEEFAYVASHDMHEPLRKILTFSERIRSKRFDALGDDERVYLDRISASAANMRHLIDNLLEFSRVSRGNRSFVQCDLNELLKEVVSDQELRIEETETTVELKNLPVLEAVPSELRQLFNNLMSNALKFRKPEVPPSIRISAHRLTHKEKTDLLLPFNHVFYRIDVEDNGIGFDAVYTEKIFEIFQRLHGKAEYSGSGIGLAICKKIVENHDGIIFASSTAGTGSTFSVILPEKQFK